MLKALLDFDNIPKSWFGNNLEQLAVMLANNILIKPKGYSRIEAKLYGGWFQNDLPTRRCQEIQAAKKSFIFPGTHGVPLRINFSLAYTLESNISAKLYKTFRESKFTKRLLYKPTISPHDCDIELAVEVLNNRICSGHHGCGETDNVYANEQKLVDSMLVADLIYLASLNQTDVCLISSDDDMVPGIVAATSLKHIYHLWTKTQPHNHYLSIYNRLHNYSGDYLRKAA